MSPDSHAACALSGDAMDDRVRAWRDVTRTALHRDGQPGRIVATYPAEAAPRLAELVEAERDCCSFLSFDIRDQGSTVTVELRYPAEFAPMLDAVLA